MPVPNHQTRVVIAGGGPAAVECALALRDLAGERVRLTLIAPDPDFELRPLRTAEPFSRDHVRRHALRDLATEVRAELVTDAVVEVDAGAHTVLVAGGRAIRYDALVLAVGGAHRPAYKRALTFTGDTSALPFNGLLADVDEGWSRGVTFVVPPGTTWTLPLYELALMTARQAWGMGIDDLRIEIVSPESTPMAVFGPQASAAVTALLERARIAFRGDAYVREGDGGRLEVLPAAEPLAAERVVALPTIEGRRIAGVPADAEGFVPVDDRGRVRGLSDVYAAGDGTSFPVKQGGLACQQADAVAELLAAAAGAPVEPQPFRPVLRGRLMTGDGAQYLEHALHGGAGEGPAPELRLWSVAQKIDGRYLSPWLAAREGDAPVPEPPVHQDDVEIAVALPATLEQPGSDRPLGASSPVPARGR